MSNFETITPVHGGLPGTAPGRIMASTEDSLATIMAAGYLNDIGEQGQIKANDIFEINYLDNSEFPLETGLSAVYQEFQVQYDPVAENWNLIPIGEPQSAIAALGVYSANYSNAGGAASVTVTDSNIHANSVVLARWKSSANAVHIQKVTPADGSFVVLSSADPGVSVLEYIAVLPSVALQDAGVVAGKADNAGGSTSMVISNANVAATDVVMANIVSSANAVGINKVTAGAGTITILFSANPGVSVISFFAIEPSAELTAAGLYAARYTNAGGSATTTITDASIGAASIVVADWNSSANAVLIQKVTPSAGQLDILSSGDPGASVLNYAATAQEEGAQAGEFLEVGNNLSDVQSASAARANLGLAIGTNVQAYDAGLQSISGLTTAADKMIYTTASDVYAVADLTAFARTLLDDATKLVALTTLGVKRGTTAAYAGGGTSNAFVATGLVSTDIVVATILASTNAVSICKAVPTADTLTITFSADPGAATTVQWHAIATV